MTAQYPPKLAAIVSDFDDTMDRDFRSEVLIDFADRFQDVPPRIATRPFPESHRVPACESKAFTFIERKVDGTIIPHFAVENPQGISAKALATILKESLEGETPETIAAIDEHLVHQLFGQSISMGKGEGLMGMIRMLKQLCSACSS